LTTGLKFNIFQSKRDLGGGDAVHKEVLIARDSIRDKVKELGAKISRDYCDRDPVIVGILNGAVFFFADLVRNITIPVMIDFIRVRSYGSAMESSGRVQITKDVEIPIDGRSVILVEDIVDSGLTLASLVSHVKGKGATSCAVCALIDKTERRQCDIDIKYCGFSIKVGFVVGYGLDYNERYRCLNDICLLKPDE
jgi:hypoxanthine phosphoribosyltransferase